MGYTLLLLSIFLIAIGLFGCVVKGIPGPPFSFLALFVLNLSQGNRLFTWASIILYAILVLIVWLPDYFVNWWSEKIYEISHTTTWGGLFGMLIGFFVFPPVGIVLGIIFGTIIGELIARKEMRKKLQEEGHSIAGIMSAMISKLSISAIISYYYLNALFSLDLVSMAHKYQYNKFSDWFQFLFH